MHCCEILAKIRWGTGQVDELGDVQGQETQGTVLCVAREVPFSPCFPVKSANYPEKNTTRDDFGPPGNRKTWKQKQHGEPSPVFVVRRIVEE